MAAWAKIDQVYGRGTVIKHRGKKSQNLYDLLAGDLRLKNLLCPQKSNQPHTIIHVCAGKVIPGSDESRALLGPVHTMHVRLRRRKGKWAKSFHNKIKSHVYHQGSEGGPQTWPLVRKVILQGPWACLSTGACLVDLPGVRDANVARSKVSENYIKNCNKIWVVAPIKRAVDDGTAKELLGEQFKRRLLMDGQYGNVSFICTQTDDCEATEIMRDHADVAKKCERKMGKNKSSFSKNL
uniref:Uncharacterized protein n=1 Tax=Corethron hystrix TaxID=216773 RepID=A0A7S1BLA9_9STRA|mmetsp:Transcript_30950/g.70743  ORF Transcript_30950/g.70743 Transcript_30950/m.70743 type:complete len:238 (+) Transcript_30950:606-1319(+)